MYCQSVAETLLLIAIYPDLPYFLQKRKLCFLDTLRENRNVFSRTVTLCFQRKYFEPMFPFREEKHKSHQTRMEDVWCSQPLEEIENFNSSEIAKLASLSALAAKIALSGTFKCLPSVNK